MKFLENYQTGTQRHEVSECGWENGTRRLARHRMATALVCKNRDVCQAQQDEGCLCSSEPRIALIVGRTFSSGPLGKGKPALRTPTPAEALMGELAPGSEAFNCEKHVLEWV